MKPYFYIFVEHFLYIDLCNYKFSVHLQAEINANTNSSRLISYLEANSGASTRKVRRQVVQVCALDRAISKLPFELGIGPICSW